MQKQKTTSALKMTQSLRTGHHATVYEVRRDPELRNKGVLREESKVVFPFVGGSHYKGSWNMDQKEGFGVQFNPNNTKYEGEWLTNKYHGRGTLWIKKGKTYNRRYVGEWSQGNMEGQGIYYYENGDIYRGGWLNNKRYGEGLMNSTNGDQYNGGWKNDLEDGFGTLSYANGNIYEGLWVKGKKEGPGLFYYASTKKAYQGEWYDDQPRCGEFRSPTVEEELRFVQLLPKGMYHNEFSLPCLGLANSAAIVDVAISDVRLRSLNKSYSQLNAQSSTLHSNDYEADNEIMNERSATRNVQIRPESLEKANKVFNSLATVDSGMQVRVVSIYKIAEVLNELGLNISEPDIEDIVGQLQMEETLDVSFSEAVEIATFIHAQKLSADAAIDY